MHCIVRALPLAVLIASVGGVAHAACTVTGGPQGEYGLLVTGASTSGGFGKFLVGVAGFNGSCGLTLALYGGENGRFGNGHVSGTYAAHGSGAPNTIDITFTPPGATAPDTYTVGYSKGANELYGVETDTTAIGTIVLEPQDFAETQPYTKSTFKGTFNFACQGDQQEFSDLNQVTFDGKGNFSGVDIYNNVDSTPSGNSVGTEPMAGTYVVYPTGLFTGSLTGYFAGYYIAGVLNNKAQTANFIYYKTTSSANSPAGAFDYCIGKK